MEFIKVPFDDQVVNGQLHEVDVRGKTSKVRVAMFGTYAHH
ncbi:MAG: hypothetical protein M0Z96_01705 [Actinomycetota bacterium]|nr:hypothetical protein [Actinomycetota bacterium]